MPTYWPVIDASGWRLAGVEGQGQNRHSWYGHATEPRLWLFKPSRADRRRAFGEEIAEKLASAIAEIVGIPAAPVQLAVRDGMAGALVEDVRPSQWELQSGQALMPEVVKDYDPTDRSHRGYNPLVIRSALERFDAPPHGGLPREFGAFDAFSGYFALRRAYRARGPTRSQLGCSGSAARNTASGGSVRLFRSRGEPRGSTCSSTSARSTSSTGPSQHGQRKVARRDSSGRLAAVARPWSTWPAPLCASVPARLRHSGGSELCRWSVMTLPG